MLNILICDDDAAFAGRLQEQLDLLLAENAIQARVVVCLSAEEIGSETLAVTDLAFLDIDFSGKTYTGLDIGRKLREVREDAVIVFITNYIEYAPEGYEIQAFRYLLKSELTDKLAPCLEQALANMRRKNSSICIRSEGEAIDIRLSELFYVEAMGHSLSYRLPNRMIESYGTLSEAEKELSERGFLRVHKSFLVNMLHIKKFSYGEVLLDNDISLPVGSRRYGDCKKQYLLWRGLQ